ncbi:cardiolipin synthase [Filimonas lacunae]|uniref:Cardiolipin synthase n=1 Tax=Filimonas lacunae TaxID=477680 RepID=A0A173MDM5_9BACT|nr:cardiolipin synthase [Filimonas lacunae]BAV05692.1 cardiolipin synthetase [Filimonas lacunae]SIT28883.1 cardiolipin synthase [Filimonas lacunae]
MLLNITDVVSIGLEVAYAISILFGLVIISQNRSPSKTLAYLLLFFALPIAGIIIYFVFGENFRKKKLYKKKFIRDKASFERYTSYLARLSEHIIRTHAEQLKGSEQLIRLVLSDTGLPLSLNNEVQLLINGEEKFQEMFQELEKAKHHIHIEYYIFANGLIINKLIDLLVKKSQEGVSVKIIYDDFGTDLKMRHFRNLKKHGIVMLPFYRILFPIVSNRHNYRDHRKMIIIDGRVAFTGGINISDRYDNTITINDLYWRDTHLKITGDAVKQLQYLFFINWGFCADEDLPVTQDYFPDIPELGTNQMVQLIHSGPDSNRASIMMSYFAAITLARDYVYITTPYFIPNESLLTALKTAALGKVDVRLLVPGVSDSRIVNAAAQSYYEELLEAGVKIYLYEKGFIHAKTMVADHCLSIVGSANMDIRSFDLNFELNATVYDEKIHDQLKEAFIKDIGDSREIILTEWAQRSKVKKMGESCCRLVSAIL